MWGDQLPIDCERNNIVGSWSFVLICWYVDWKPTGEGCILHITHRK